VASIKLGLTYAPTGGGKVPGVCTIPLNVKGGIEGVIGGSPCGVTGTPGGGGTCAGWYIGLASTGPYGDIIIYEGDIVCPGTIVPILNG
jgi:hypothetical protein